MRELIERLEKAEAGSRELDFWIAFESGALSDVIRDRPCRVDPGPGDEFTLIDANGKRAGWVGYHVISPVTASLDAALALAERVLPGWLWEATTITTTIGGIRKPLAVVVDPEGENDDVRTFGTAATPALAFCIAILRALRTTEQPCPAKED